jgi:hypothetical protein
MLMRVAKLSHLVVALFGVTLAIACVDATDRFIDETFPEGPGAQSIRQDRMTICGRVGKYRRYCGVPDDFVGPLEDPRRQWNRQVP